jgi:hypothetical protein
MAAETGNVPCPGPLAACMRSTVLAPWGVAMHYGGRVRCVACSAEVTIARYVPDAQRDPIMDAPMGGHLCRRCDPCSPTVRGRKP